MPSPRAAHLASLILMTAGLSSCETSPAQKPLLRDGWWAVVASRISNGSADFQAVAGAYEASPGLGFAAPLGRLRAAAGAWP